jgi:hypothetical protein
VFTADEEFTTRRIADHLGVTTLVLGGATPAEMQLLSSLANTAVSKTKYLEMNPVSIALMMTEGGSGDLAVIALMASLLKVTLSKLGARMRVMNGLTGMRSELHTDKKLALGSKTRDHDKATAFHQFPCIDDEMPSEFKYATYMNDMPGRLQVFRVIFSFVYDFTGAPALPQQRLEIVHSLVKDLYHRNKGGKVGKLSGQLKHHFRAHDLVKTRISTPVTIPQVHGSCVIMTKHLAEGAVVPPSRHIFGHQTMPILPSKQVMTVKVIWDMFALNLEHASLLVDAGYKARGKYGQAYLKKKVGDREHDKKRYTSGGAATTSGVTKKRERE